MPRPEVMGHMVHENVGLLATRQTRDEWGVHTSNTIATHKSFSAYDSTTLFPLYLYPKAEKTDLFDMGAEATDAPGGRRPNLSDDFIAEFSQRLGLKFVADGRGDLKKTFGPEDVFHYMYAVFHAPTYRERYAEYLAIDFPRLPLTSNVSLFRALCGLGRELTGLHLMAEKAPRLTSYPVDGGHEVEKVVYKPPEGDQPGRVWINKTQYFEGVPPEVWTFHIGGYQVCDKWLKDRRGRTLSFDDIQTYQDIVAALSRTSALMAEIDAAVVTNGGWPLQ